MIGQGDFYGSSLFGLVTRLGFWVNESFRDLNRRVKQISYEEKNTFQP